MHSVNKKGKVRAANVLVAKVLQMIKKIFLRTKGHGHKVPKLHDMAKMVHYMRLFEDGLNVHEGPGVLHHKYFMKALGQNAQLEVSKFAKQIANRVYDSMILNFPANQ